MARAALLLGGALGVLLTAVAQAGPPEEPKAPTIRRARLLDETITRLGGNGDNWHTTWADDDLQYTGLCDGFGLPGLPQKWYNSRLFTVAGHPPSPKFGYLPGYPDLLNQSRREFGRYYGFGVLAHGRHIYHFLSTPRVPLYDPDPRFVGAKLIYSPDAGKTWHNQDGSTPVVWEDWGKRARANMAFYEEPGDAFSLPSVLQMGKGYRDNRDGYAYVYAPNGSTEGTMNQLVMFRVPVGKLPDRRAYEYFAGQVPGGGASWSRELADRRPVHTFPRGWVNKVVTRFNVEALEARCTPSFGAGGVVAGGTGFVALDSVVQPDNRVIVVGLGGSGRTAPDFAVARFNADGTLDTGFGTNGIATLDFKWKWDQALKPSVEILKATHRQ